MSGASSDQDYFSVYRALAGVWLIFALAWMALLLNQAARLLHLIVALLQPAGRCWQNQEQDNAESGGVLPSSRQDTPKL